MNRIDAKFKQLKKQGRKGFIAYITGGDPDLSTTEKLVVALAGRGVDIIELGVPFSDPMADGPTIQRASERALRKKTTLDKIIRTVARIRKKTDIPIVLFTYLNPVFKYGWSKFARLAARAGVDGVLVLDLPVEESGRGRRLLKEQGIEMIYLVAPTSSEQRIKMITGQGSGFIYYVSRTGVTGMRRKVARGVKPMVAKIKKYTTLPVAVGFGVSCAGHVREVGRYADAVVVGSAIVAKIEENKGCKDLTGRIARFTAGLTGPCVRGKKGKKR